MREAQALGVNVRHAVGHELVHEAVAGRRQWRRRDDSRAHAIRAAHDAVGRVPVAQRRRVQFLGAGRVAGAEPVRQRGRHTVRVHVLSFARFWGLVILALSLRLGLRVASNVLHL